MGATTSMGALGKRSQKGCPRHRKLTKRSTVLSKRGTSPLPATEVKSRNPKSQGVSRGSEVNAQSEDSRVWDSCGRELEEIMRLPEAQCFLLPVDWVKLKLPLYPNVIKNFIDLGTIARKLDGLDYSDTHDFNKDMELVWSNARKFNNPGSHIFMLQGF